MTALISATELITRYYSNEKLAQCCFNVRPTSATLADIKPTFGECAVLAGKALTINMLEVNCFQCPMVKQPFVSQHKAHMREMVNYFLIDVAQVYRVYMTWELALNVAMCMKRIWAKPATSRLFHKLISKNKLFTIPLFTTLL